MSKSVLIFFLILIPALSGSHCAEAQSEVPGASAWSDSLMRQMTLDEKIGQLFMLPVYSNKDAKYRSELQKTIREYHIGGIIFMQGGPVRQIRLYNALQSVSKIPLLVSQDAEWGLGMRLDSTHSFPRQLTLGAIRDHRLIYDFATEIARQCRAVGVHLNFAPVVDVNNNINNPVINDRSFGENRYAVALRGLEYMKGLQEHGVMACAKHFPGHGDTEKDSHHDLPLIPHSRARLDSIELFPFRILIRQGVMSVMTAHLQVPALEPDKGIPSSLSPRIVSELLKKEMKFRGLVITDALSMKGAGAYSQPGLLNYKAFMAGNDILLFPQDVPETMALFREKIKSGELSMSRLDESVKKILNAKYRMGLNHWKPLPEEDIYKRLNNRDVEALHLNLLAHAITLACDSDSLLPLKLVDTLEMATLSIAGEGRQFESYFARYKKADHFRMEKNAPRALREALLGSLKDYECVVVNVFSMSRYASRNFGLDAGMLDFLKKLNAETRVIIVLYGSPYSLEFFDFADHVIVAYEETPYAEMLVPQFIFGGRAFRGQLPVSVSNKFFFGRGLRPKAPIRLGYGMPGELGYSSAALDSIDTIVHEALRIKATPGCQVMLVKDGLVIYEKAFGHPVYHSQKKVRMTDLYDLASITKVAATTISLMYLFDNKQLELNTTLSDYLPELQGTRLEKLKLRDILTHTAGLQAWIPFYTFVTQNDSLYEYYFHYRKDSIYSVEVAEDLYMREVYEDSIFQRIVNSKLQYPVEYQYSDLGFYLFKELIEAVTRTPLDSFVQEIFYHPLGLQTMTYRPLEKFPKERIIPTEMDQEFRHQLIHGYVHDPGAAMWGGVSGHAGLFSDANDLAILMQMLLNGGQYGGERFLNDSTVRYFTSRHNALSRRGYGFDKPILEDNGPSPVSHLAPKSVFGHTGFTGTAAWVDPENRMIFIFLSNRIHPSAENRKLITENIRTRIQDVLYRTLLPSGAGN